MASYCYFHKMFLPCSLCYQEDLKELRELEASEAITDKFPVFRKSTLKRTTVRDPRVEMPKVKK